MKNIGTLSDLVGACKKARMGKICARVRDEADLRAQLKPLSPPVMVEEKDSACDKRDPYNKSREVHEPMILGAWLWLSLFLGEMRFPLEVEQSERPDFVVRMGGECIGLEVTKIDDTNQQSCHEKRRKGEIPPEQACHRRGAAFRDCAPEIIANEVDKVVKRKTKSLRGFSCDGGLCDLAIDHNQLPESPEVFPFFGFSTNDWDYPKCESHRERLLDRLRRRLIPRIREDKVLRRVVIFNVGGDRGSCFVADFRNEEPEFLNWREEESDA